MTTQTIQFESVSLSEVGSGAITAFLFAGTTLAATLASIAENGTLKGRYTGTVEDIAAGDYRLVVKFDGFTVNEPDEVVTLLLAVGTYVSERYAVLNTTARVKLDADQPDYAPATASALSDLQTDVDGNTGYLTGLTSALSALSGKFSGITLLADWLRRAFRKDAGTTGMATAETEIQTGATATYTGTTDNLEAIKDASGGGASDHPLATNG